MCDGDDFVRFGSAHGAVDGEDEVDFYAVWVGEVGLLGVVLLQGGEDDAHVFSP